MYTCACGCFSVIGSVKMVPSSGSFYICLFSNTLLFPSIQYIFNLYLSFFLLSIVPKQPYRNIRLQDISIHFLFISNEQEASVAKQNSLWRYNEETFIRTRIKREPIFIYVTLDSVIMIIVKWCDVYGLISAAPDGAPQDVQLEAISSQSIKVTWKVKAWYL